MNTRSNSQPAPISQLVKPIFNQDERPVTSQPREGSTGIFVKNFGKFERKGSTYMWLIKTPHNKFFGYSKPLNMAEKNNKQELLFDCIRRLKNKYIIPGNRIDFYRCFTDNDADNVSIFTLFGTRYDPQPVIIGEAWLIKYLADFYNPVIHNYGTEMFPTGEQKTAPPAGTAIIPDLAKQAPAKDPFDLGRSFKSSEALMKYVEKLLLDGHPHGQVSDFYRKKMQAFTSRPL